MKQHHLPLFLVALLLGCILYLGARLQTGEVLENDLLALLPRAESDPALQKAEDQVARSFSRRIVLLAGAEDLEQALVAGRILTEALRDSGMVSSLIEPVRPEDQRRMAETYMPFRGGLLANQDRKRLLDGAAAEIVARARSLIYAPGGFANAGLVARDPFFLLPAFFTDLPIPQSKLVVRDGALTVQDGTMTYVFLSATLNDDAFSLSVEKDFTGVIGEAERQARATVPSLSLLRTGAVFYAAAGAAQATSETSRIGLISSVGTILLILGVFRGVRPMLLGVLAIGAGVLAAFAFCLWWFGSLHVLALLIGTSLIGISVDYCLQYFCEYFDAEAQGGRDRLRRILPGIALGLATTLVGYLTLLLAPFPGLRQMSLFSVVGLAVSFAVVALWYPLLDRDQRRLQGARLLKLAHWPWYFWEARSLSSARAALLAGLVVAAAVGAFFFSVDDDVRHMQSLSPELRRQELAIQRLTGAGANSQFFLIEAGDEQAALEAEEALLTRLDQARSAGLVTGYTALAQFVPSILRQRQNRQLIEERLLTPFLASYRQEIGLVEPGVAPQEGYLTIDSLPKEGPLAFVSSLALSRGTHVVLLDGVTNPAALARMTAGIGGTRFVSPAEDISRLFGRYRWYAILLLGLSALLMLPVLAWRYGAYGALRVIAPSLAAILLTPPLVAVAGIQFSFFGAMALVLVLSIGVDYAVFFRETSGARKPVTMVAVFLAALSTILSFGLLALSGVASVSSFGSTVLVGISLSFLLAPAAGQVTTAAASDQR